MLRNLLKCTKALAKTKWQPLQKEFISAATAVGSRRYIGLQHGQNDPYYAGTMAEVKEEIMNRLGLEAGYSPVPRTREHLLKYEPKLSDLPPRSMQDSFTSAILPLSVDKNLQDKYISFLGNVRMGRLMEDMDLFAVWVCHQHVKLNNLPENVHLPYTFVTILVDKITFSDMKAKATEDVRISGHVSWVGKSSMEIVVWLEQKDNGVWEKITRALFLMAARNATNTAAAPVNPIQPANEEETKILNGGVERKKRRQILQASSIFKVEPNDYEQSLMYDLFKRTTPQTTMELNKRVLPPKCRWMSDSFVTNTMASFPENRNAHNKVFGGFLMRNALEISWVGANLYLKSRPKLEHICDISFEQPVSVNSFIKMTAYVVYTDVNYLQMMTVADVIDAATGNQLTSNVFYYTFSSADEVPVVLPKSYHETMWYIQGRRKFKYALGLE
ncbi:LOW QUALITY PROTEIN: acyl-coenzyme A thioesterase 9, mitochondrial-like [Lucilia sericata]|uniref:LOW QUALITY PROTEIN: acyl-coenzyme A thioesterase 9, mitochondrial-like n=1 Tax=Lucilia sericata TaxID=13632 RepID=UPI0018A7EA2A|nr:LOW QUALITY PROTEIN: acyl-coenzyme A thioesterase 9, mitochondrial-like [Lucilia sericata]